MDMSDFYGKWIDRKSFFIGGTISKCSRCCYQVQSLSGTMNFCPECGRAMTRKGRNIIANRLKKIDRGST